MLSLDTAFNHVLNTSYPS